MSYRVILFHKHPTSARTLFLKFKDNSVCSLEKIPDLAQLIDHHPDSLLHPAFVLSQLEKELGFPPAMLKAEGEYLQHVEVPGEVIQIILANINSMDPPFELAEKIGASFIDLTQARGLPQIELELLRHAYELVLGG
jgi:hypothetical protein